MPLVLRRAPDSVASAIAHVEVEDDVPHVIFDVLEAWRPRDFPNDTINYNDIKQRLFGYIRAFNLAELSFDP